jgi:hypothetical protein
MYWNSRFFMDAAELRNIYWRIRASKFSREFRKWYRKAAKEKGRLKALGYDPELIRLFCLHMRRPNNEKREKRFSDYLEKQQGQLTLF